MESDDEDTETIDSDRLAAFWSFLAAPALIPPTDRRTVSVEAIHFAVEWKVRNLARAFAWAKEPTAEELLKTWDQAASATTVESRFATVNEVAHTTVAMLVDSGFVVVDGLCH